jgi:hypothetical protein
MLCYHTKVRQLPQLTKSLMYACNAMVTVGRKSSTADLVGDARRNIIEPTNGIIKPEVKKVRMAFGCIYAAPKFLLKNSNFSMRMFFRFLSAATYDFSK